MNEKNRAILLLVKTKTSKVKHINTNRVTVTQNKPADGNAEWVRFKTECVLLKPTKKGVSK